MGCNVKLFIYEFKYLEELGFSRNILIFSIYTMSYGSIARSIAR